MTEKILILDFGSQYTQLIARRVRELNVYSEIVPFSHSLDLSDDIKGVILSGSPCSVFDENSPNPEVEKLFGQVPVLGICYGAQLLANKFGGKVARSDHREYGRANLTNVVNGTTLFEGISNDSQVWMSHGD